MEPPTGRRTGASCLNCDFFERPAGSDWGVCLKMTDWGARELEWAHVSDGCINFGKGRARWS